MNIFLLIIFSYFGTFAAKAFFIFISSELDPKFRVRVKKYSNKLMMLAIFLPFSSLALRKDSLIKKRRVFQVSEILGFVTLLIFGAGIRNLLAQFPEEYRLESALVVIFFLTVTISLLYLAVFDLLYLQIPVFSTTRLLFFVVVVNVLVGVIDLIFSISAQNPLSLLGSPSNLIGFLILYFGTYALIVLTKEEGIGSGDADINAIVGISLGIPAALTSVFVSIMAGSLLGIAFAMYRKKIKGVLIPMVPLILIGYTISIGFSDELIDVIIIN